jgi:parallel beta-helix repeat protein
MNKTVEGLYNPKDNAWIGNSFFDSNQTKFNIMSASNVTFENNTVMLASLNAGDGSWEHQGNNNTLLNNKFILTGVASRKTGTKILNNTFSEGMPSGGNVPIRVWGFNFSVMNNEITKGDIGVLVQPHPFYQSAGNHLVRNNIINSSGVGISIIDEYNNQFINNQIKNTYRGAGIQVENSSNQVFFDNSISNSKTYDVYLKGKNDNISFINTEFNETKIGFNDSKDVLFPHDQVLFSVNLDLGAGILAKKDLVARLHIEGN